MNRTLAAVTIGALVVAVTAASCKKKDDEIPALPSAAPEPTPAPTPTLELAVEDAGPDADAEAGKKAVGNYDPTRLMACCRALEQNAKSAPPMQAPALLAAAQACKAAVSSGNFKAAEGYGCK